VSLTKSASVTSETLALKIRRVHSFQAHPMILALDVVGLTSAVKTTIFSFIGMFTITSVSFLSIPSVHMTYAAVDTITVVDRAGSDFTVSSRITDHTITFICKRIFSGCCYSTQTPITARIVVADRLIALFAKVTRRTNAMEVRCCCHVLASAAILT